MVLYLGNGGPAGVGDGIAEIMAGPVDVRMNTPFGGVHVIDDAGHVDFPRKRRGLGRMTVPLRLEQEPDDDRIAHPQGAGKRLPEFGVHLTAVAHA